jgi:hypothetical protein
MSGSVSLSIYAAAGIFFIADVQCRTSDWRCARAVSVGSRNAGRLANARMRAHAGKRAEG